MKTQFRTILHASSAALAVGLASFAPQLRAADPAGTPATSGDESANEAASRIDDYQKESSDANKAEVKAALTRLDVDIDLLAAKIDGVADANRKAELKARLDSYKTRRAGLNSEFRRARYDALAADVKEEWSRLID